MCFKNDNPIYNPKTGERHQTVSWGVIVADAETLKPVEDLYVEIKWNEKSKEQRAADPSWGSKAETIHGLTQEYLEKNGVTEEEACCLIGELILKYWGPDGTIRTLGHNVHTFDMPHFRDMFARHEIPLRFGSRHYDTNSGGFFTFGTWNSDDLFSMVGFEDRNAHNALDDAHMSLASARAMRLIFQKALEG